MVTLVDSSRPQSGEGFNPEADQNKGGIGDGVSVEFGEFGTIANIVIDLEGQ